MSIKLDTTVRCLNIGATLTATDAILAIKY